MLDDDFWRKDEERRCGARKSSPEIGVKCYTVRKEKEGGWRRNERKREREEF